MAVQLRKLLWWWPQYDFHGDSKLQDVTADTYVPIEDQPREVELLTTSSQDTESSKDEVRAILSIKCRRDGFIASAIGRLRLPLNSER